MRQSHLPDTDLFSVTFVKFEVVWKLFNFKQAVATKEIQHLAKLSPFRWKMLIKNRSSRGKLLNQTSANQTCFKISINEIANKRLFPTFLKQQLKEFNWLRSMKNRMLFDRLLLKRHICRAVPSWDYTIAQFAINVTLRWIFQIISMLNSWTKSYSCKRHLVANYLLRCQTNSCYSNLICRNSFWFLVSVIVIYRGPDHGSRIKKKTDIFHE